MELTHKRDRQIDVLRTWGIILVIAGHSGSPFSTYIYTFHMPLFFFISGYLHFHRKEKPWGTFIRDKVKSLLIPYVVFWAVNNLIYYPVFRFLTTHTLPSFGWNNVLGLILGGHWLADYSSDFQLWFLQLLFIASIVFEFIVRYCRKPLMVIVFFLVAWVTLPFQSMFPGRPVFHINVLPSALVFMLTGYFFHALLEHNDILQSLKSNLPIGCVLLILGGGYFSLKRR